MGSAGWEAQLDDTCTLPAERPKLALEKYLYEECGFNLVIKTSGHYVMFPLCRETLSTLREPAFNPEAVD